MKFIKISIDKFKLTFLNYPSLICGGVGIRGGAIIVIAAIRVHHYRSGTAQRIEHHGALVHRIRYLADQRGILDEQLYDYALLVYVQIVDFVYACVNDVWRETHGQIKRIHLVERFLCRDLLEKMHQIDEHLKIYIGQLETQIEDGLELGFGRVQLHCLYKIGVEWKGEQ